MMFAFIARHRTVWPLASRHPTSAAGHAGAGSSFVHEHQTIWLKIELPFEPFEAPPQDLGAFLFGGVSRHFLRVIPCRLKNRQIALPLQDRPTPANFAWISAR